MKSIVEAKTSAANTKLEIELLPGYNDTIIVSTNNDNNNLDTALLVWRIQWARHY